METWRGRVVVRGSGRPIAGAIVSDGFRVAATDANGGFELAAHDEQSFIFVSSPGDFAPPTDEYRRPLFHRALPPADPLLFELEPVSLDKHSFALLSDLHLGRGDGKVQFPKNVIPRVNALKPSFVLIGGDISFQEGVIEDILAMQRLFEAPVYHAIGNHEMMMDRLHPKRAFQRLLGPTYYSFTCGRVHYVMLDGCTPAPYRTGWQNVVGFIDDVQLRWLEEDLARVAPGHSVVAFIHIPIVSQYSERRGIGPKEEPAWEIMNDDKVVDLLAKHKVKVVFQGHMHENEHIHCRGIRFIETASVSGAWWAGDNVDGSPQGFRLVTCEGAEVSSAWVATDPGDGHLLGAEMVGPAARGDNGTHLDLIVNVFDGDPAETKVECREKGNGYWAVMKALPIDVHPHKWRGTVTVCAGVRPGLELEVRVSGSPAGGTHRVTLNEKGVLSGA